MSCQDGVINLQCRDQREKGAGIVQCSKLHNRNIPLGIIQQLTHKLQYNTLLK
jgi:hypothetical protein